MWVVYHKKEQRIVGLTAISPVELEKEEAIGAILAGIPAKDDVDEYDALVVEDRSKALLYMSAYPEKLVLAGTKTKPLLTIREPESYSLYVTCDAPDKHPVDGIPEIPSDGASFATFAIQKIDERSKPQRGAGDNDVLYLRTNHGIIYDAEGKEQISSLKLKKGQAAFRVVSESVKRVATIQLLSVNPLLSSTELRLEFV